MHEQTITKPLNCKHCGLPIVSDQAVDQFCCHGCALVYQILSENQLTDFYRLREQDQVEGVPAIAAADRDFEYFDDPEFLKKNLRQLNTEQVQVSFLLKGLHCLACIWLLERLPQLCSGLTSSRVDFSNATITLIFDPLTVKVSKIAATINSLGYIPLEVSKSNQSKNLSEEIKQYLYRLGVAGVCAGNIMMIAVSMYQAESSGIEQHFDYFLRLISIVLSIPVMTYAAWPFYRAAWQGLKIGILHIDLPISVGVILGFFLSTYNFLRNSGHIYFDSLSVLIFLMLAGRLLQKLSLGRALKLAESSRFLEDHAFRKEQGQIKKVYFAALLPGDQVFVPSGSRIPVDGKVLEGHSQVDLSVLTGESLPLAVAPGAAVLAGSSNLDQDLLIEASTSFDTSRFGQLLQNLKLNAGSGKIGLSLSDRISHYFVPSVLLIAIINFMYWLTAIGSDQAISTTLALLVITCPCAVGLAAPLTLVSAISQALRRGIYIKNAQAFELLAQAQVYVFDKTGTATVGDFKLQQVKIAEETLNRFECDQIVLALEARSEHPLARSLLRQLPSQKISQTLISNYHESSGLGVSAKISDQSYFFGSLKWVEEQADIKATDSLTADSLDLALAGNTLCYLARPGEILATYVLGDRLQEGFFHLIRAILPNRQVYLASGDRQEIVDRFGRELKLPTENCRGNLLPEQKAALVESLKQSYPNQTIVMVGDGVNDVAAMAAADLGIGVSGGVVRALQAADVFISKYSVQHLRSLMEGSIKTIRRVQLIIGLSLTYNLVGAILSVTGNASPLLAALLMPISSLTVIVLASTFKLFRSKLLWK